MKKINIFSIFLILASLNSSCFASEQNKVHDFIKETFASLNVEVDSVNKSEVKGLYEVISETAVYYISEDGNYLINGNVYAINDGMKNLTGDKIESLRKVNTAKQFARIKDFENDMIVYKAVNEKYVITVFSDTSCSYCQRLHSEMSDYNKAGITIRYLAFPRGGKRSPAFSQMVSVWCSDDRKTAMNRAKNHLAIESATCDNNVFEQYELGVSLGIKGTPTLFFEDGTAAPGYLPVDQLIRELEK